MWLDIPLCHNENVGAYKLECPFEDLWNSLYKQLKISGIDSFETMQHEWLLFVVCRRFHSAIDICHDTEREKERDADPLPLKTCQPHDRLKLWLS